MTLHSSDSWAIRPMKWQMLVCLALLNVGFMQPLLAASASDYQLLDLKLLNADKEDIRKSLYKWDGFDQTQSTVKRAQFNRFYPKNILREMYRLDFRYQKNNQFASLRILYRSFEPEFSNQHQGIDTEAIVQQLIPMIGVPKSRKYRTSPGIRGYNAYTWEDDNMSIVLDRESQHPGRPPILNIKVKATDLARNYRP